MIDSVETPLEAQPTRRDRMRALAARRGLIGAAGAFSLIAGGLMGAIWLVFHRSYWGGQFWCFLPQGAPGWFRHSLTLIAFASAITATASLAGIAKSRSSPPVGLVKTYWIASIALWMALAVMVFEVGVSFTCNGDYRV